jgi:hypothetical protein
MMELAKLRSRALKYLAQGVFLRPPTLGVPKSTLPMSRLSIYAGQQGALTSFEGNYPLVLAGAWRAPDGDVAVVLASIANEPLTVPLVLGKDYGLRRKGSIYRLSRLERRQIGEFDGRHVSLTVPLSPQEACVVEFGR